MDKKNLKHTDMHKSTPPNLRRFATLSSIYTPHNLKHLSMYVFGGFVRFSRNFPFTWYIGNIYLVNKFTVIVLLNYQNIVSIFKYLNIYLN